MSSLYNKNMAYFKYSASIYLTFTLALLAFLFAFSVSVLADTTASVDRVDVKEGNIINFTIKSDASSRYEPNIIPLQQYFVVQGNQKSSQTTFINGDVRSFTEWRYMLIPKKTGRIDIPAITVGTEKTAPISIMVSKAGSSANSSSGNGAGQAGASNSSLGMANGVDVFIEANVNTRKVYEQSQLLYVVRLFSSTEIESGTWPNPSTANALIEKIGEDLVYQDTRAGRMYNVIERRYAIFPQDVGEFKVPPSEFTGTVLAAGAMGNIAPVGFGAINAFFNTSQPVKVRSDALTVQVMPKPKSFKGDLWLPAFDLKLSESFTPVAPVFKQGEAVTMTIELTASGLIAARLPDINLPSVANLKVYPAKSEKVNVLGDKGIVGKITKSVVLMPESAGQFTLPEIKVVWWNLAKGVNETAVIPAATFTVAGGQPTSASAQKKQSADNNVAAVNTVKSPAKQDGEANPASDKTVRYIVFGAVTLVLIIFITAGLFVLLKKGKDETEILETDRQRSLHALFKDFEKKASGEKASSKEIANALLMWGKAYFLDNPPLNITDIGNKLKSDKLKKELEELNQSIYAVGKSDFDGQLLVQALTEALERKKQEDKAFKPVPELYPEV